MYIFRYGNAKGPLRRETESTFMLVVIFSMFVWSKNRPLLKYSFLKTRYLFCFVLEALARLRFDEKRIYLQSWICCCLFSDFRKCFILEGSEYIHSIVPTYKMYSNSHKIYNNSISENCFVFNNNYWSGRH